MHVALLGWIPVVLVFFTLMPPFRAVLLSLIAAWLFLPMWYYIVGGLPDVNKMSFACFGALIGVILFDANRFFAFRPSIYDGPMLLWCAVPFIAGTVNGGEFKASVSQSIEQTVTWGLPYFIGRLYLTSPSAFREAALAIVLGGLVYIPFCLYEIVMSPQLHRMIYGFHQHTFAQTARAGGWRPMVFMQHGLMVAAWMTSATVVAAWLWLCGSARKVGGVPIGVATISLLATSAVLKSLGALVLMMVGLGCLAFARYLRVRGLILLVALAPIAYIGVRVLGGGADPLVKLAEIVSPDRAASFEFRVINENILIAKAMEKPVMGWGWGKARVAGTVTDGLWIIYFGSYGVIGLAALYGFLLGLPSLVAFKVRHQHLSIAIIGPVLALVVVAVLFSVDTIPNAMLNPIFSMVAGGMAGLLVMLRAGSSPRPGGIGAGAAPRAGVVAVGARGPVGSVVVR